MAARAKPNREMQKRAKPTVVRCAIYTRKSTEEGLEQDFNTLDAQREAAAAFILSQRHEGWAAVPKLYDDGGFTGANMDRPALQLLLADIARGEVNCVVVYKVDRLTRSLLDFSRIMDVLDRHEATFVAVTQQFNTTSSLGRLTLNILLSFAQFEREMISERTRDKMSAARRKGKWMGGTPVLGYDFGTNGAGLVVNRQEAVQVGEIYRLYLEWGSPIRILAEIKRRGWRLKSIHDRQRPESRECPVQQGHASPSPDQPGLYRKGPASWRDLSGRARGHRRREYLDGSAEAIAPGRSPRPAPHLGPLRRSAEGHGPLRLLRCADDTHLLAGKGQATLSVLYLRQSPPGGMGSVRDPVRLRARFGTGCRRATRRHGGGRLRDEERSAPGAGACRDIVAAADR